MPSLCLIAVVVTALAVLGRQVWPTHLGTPKPPEIPQHPDVPRGSDRSTGRWLRECEAILAAGTGRHRAPTRLAGWVR